MRAEIAEQSRDTNTSHARFELFNTSEYSVPVDPMDDLQCESCQ